MSDLKSRESAQSEKGNSSVEIQTVPSSAPANHSTHRVLKPRQIQMFSIGGVIGTAVFVSIGGALTRGGPLFLLLGYAIWSGVIYCVNECMAEMTCELPINSGFSRFASRFVDDAFGTATAWNYLLCMTSLCCFEITAFHSVLQFWTDLHPAIIPAVMLVSYLILHLYSAAWFGESEFWIVLGKILLMLMLFMFTFVTMCGGNPLHDAFGFRYWRDPGAVKTYLSTGSSGELQAFITCLLSAAFAVAGPDMLSMIAAEAINPRKVMPVAFKTVFYRLIIFFVLSALSVGILVPYNDPILLNAIKTGATGAGRSPYVAAMTRLGVPVLPHIVNAGILTSIYSAGSAFFFNGSRILHAMAHDGIAPKFFQRTNRNGVPWIACLAIAVICCLSFLQVSSGTNKVLDWFINISTATQLVTWMSMCITWIRWSKARTAQGLSREDLRYKSWCQPYAAWVGLFASTLVTLINGYYVFLNGGWAVADFIFSYGSPIFFVFVFFVRKALVRTGPVKAVKADLVTGLAEIEEHEALLADQMDPEGAPTSRLGKFKAWIL